MKYMYGHHLSDHYRPILNARTFIFYFLRKLTSSLLALTIFGNFRQSISKYNCVRNSAFMRSVESVHSVHVAVIFLFSDF